MEIVKQSRPAFLKDQLNKSWILAKKNIRIFYNKAPVFITSIIFPIVLYLAFSMNRVIPALFTVSGLLAMTLLLSASSIGPMVFPWETMAKTFERIMTTPVSIYTLLLGDILASMVFGLVICSVPIILGFVLGLLLVNPLTLVLAIIMGCFSFGCFGMILSAPPTDSPSNIVILTMLTKFPIIFISPIFVPIQAVPWTIISPLTPFIDIINYSFSGLSYFGTFGPLLDIGLMALWTSIFILIGFNLHKKTLNKRFKN